MSAWLDQIWPATNGPARVARRKVTAVNKYSSEAELIREAKARGLHVAQVGKQFFIFRDPIDVKC